MSDIRIPLADLRIGHYVKLPLSWKQHPFLFSAFRIKDESQLAIIHTLGLDEIVVDPSKSTVEINITPCRRPSSSARQTARHPSQSPQGGTTTTAARHSYGRKSLYQFGLAIA